MTACTYALKPPGIMAGGMNPKIVISQQYQKLN